MKASKFTDAQKAFVIKQGEEGTPVAEVCRKAGISQATYFNWKKKYAGLLPSEMRRLRELEDENSRLKKIVADLTLDREMLQDVIKRKPLRPDRKRELVDGMLLDWGVSIRRACRVLPFDTSSYHYQSRRTDPAFLKKRIKEICETHVRYGYRRVYHILRREGWVVNAKKVYRLYKELGLQLRNKTPKRRVKAKLREDRTPAIRPNDVWAMDFVHDQLATGRKLRILTVVDTYSRLSPVVDPRFSYRGEDVVAALEQACREIGYPKTIRVDNGSELISREMDLWAYQRGVTLDFSRPGKPTDNAFIEAFNSKLRSECLNAHWFLSLQDACEKLEAWRRHYNEERPHSAIGNIPPIMLANSAGESSPPDLSKAENSRPERSKVG
ncbi:MAG: IS3 family transposase [Erythrobacter sp.]|uniref:IS3 family transposase n=1 Tax=Erythrobacter sp. TaxID=1042 RepID=UPI0025D6EA3B|nr:IS3 family transposase [Erythrobacter sp.]MCL9998660.1 IS3 family transposase [Erythrobacter sp.]